MNRFDQDRNANMLCGPLARKGYLRWWHSFTGINASTGERRTFFVEYLILNPIAEKPKKDRPARPSYVRVSAGAFPCAQDNGVSLRAYYPIQAAKYARKPLYFQVNSQVLTENRISGSIQISPADAIDDTEDTGSMEWNVEINKTLACHTGLLASPVFSALNVLDSFWHGEGIRSEYRGSVRLNDQEYTILEENAFGYADKHWGSRYPSPWLQLASCRLYSERTGKLLKHSALAVDGCCPRFLFFRLRPRLLLQLTYTGEDFCYSFANPLCPSRVKWTIREGKKRLGFHIKAQNRDSLLKLSMQCEKTNMMPLQYDDPAGNPVYGRRPLRAGASAFGSITLYRMTPEGKVWIDTLTVQDGLCMLQKAPSSKTATKEN